MSYFQGASRPSSISIVNIFFVYIVKQLQKKFADFIKKEFVDFQNFM